MEGEPQVIEMMYAVGMESAPDGHQYKCPTNVTL